MSFDFKKLSEDSKKKKSCACDGDTIEKEKGPHVGVYCGMCDKWLRWKPKTVNYEKEWNTFRMPFGKHEGKLIKELPHHYLKWGAENLDDDPVLQKMLSTAFQKLTKKVTRSSFPPVSGKDIYKLVDCITNADIHEGELNDLKVKVREVWPKFVMTHPSFIAVAGEVVGRIEFVRKSVKIKKDKTDETNLLFD